MGSLFFYLQNDDNFHDLGDEFGGVLFAASFVGQNLFTQNHQGGVVCGIPFDGGVAPLFGVLSQMGGCGGIIKKMEIRFGGGHGPNNAHYFVLLLSGGV